MQGLAQPLGHVLGLRDTVDERQQDGELVPAEPGDGVALPQHRLQSRAHLAEQLVAVGVAQGVVDLLEAVQVDQQQGDLAVRPAGGGESLVEAVAQQLPVGQTGQGVVRGLVAVPLGRGLQGLGLAAELFRRRRDEAEDDEVEDGQAGGQRDRHGADVLGGRGGDRRVREVELDDAVRPVRPVVLQGHVDLEQLVGAVLAGGAVVGRVREAGDDVAVERGTQLAGTGRFADQLGVLGVVDDRAVAVEDLQLDRVERGEREPRRPELLGGLVHDVLHVGQAGGVEAGLEVGRGELRLEAQAHRHEGGVLRLLAGAVLDGGAQHGGEHRPDGDREQQADHAEAGQEARAAQPPEKGHA
ncbi:hypothetical protein U6N30_27080 [Blastococcus brunescens]|uniref:Uncharacterized protein n=1 Tax=Blastococcus brunescens TaxID=1564165 RepID=A0ABZ1B0V4_9ACTN|nr:hypothetical protein [Blastococcus sp. BMG 8361]WRL63368.1 hypothetical protein U6N30_27080 [Blastococcus sp. BMG 8361]